MYYKPLIPTAIALALSWSAIAAADSASITTGNVSVSSSRNGATVSTNRVRATTNPRWWYYPFGISTHSSASRAAAVRRTRTCSRTAQQQTSRSSSGSIYQSQASQVCR